MTWLAANWGNLVSALGTAISIATLFFARSASRAAAEAQRSAIRTIAAYDLLAAWQTVIAELEQLRELIKHARWDNCIDRCHAISKELAASVELSDPLERDDLIRLAGVVSSIRRTFEKSASGQRTETTHLSQVLTDQISKLVRLRTRRTTGVKQ